MRFDPNDCTPLFDGLADAEAAVAKGGNEKHAALVTARVMREGWTAQTLSQEPVLSQGQADDLHHEVDGLRVWLSRTGIADGEPFENTVTVEEKVDGSWVTVAKYDGGEVEEEEAEEARRVKGSVDPLETDGEAAAGKAPGFSLHIEMGNAAMLTFGDVAAEVRTVLEQIEEEHDAGCTVNGGTIADSNGNNVGAFTLTLPDEEAV